MGVNFPPNHADAVLAKLTEPQPLSHADAVLEAIINGVAPPFAPAVSAASPAPASPVATSVASTASAASPAPTTPATTSAAPTTHSIKQSLLASASLASRACAIATLPLSLPSLLSTVLIGHATKKTPDCIKNHPQLQGAFSKLETDSGIISKTAKAAGSIAKETATGGLSEDLQNAGGLFRACSKAIQSAFPNMWEKAGKAFDKGNSLREATDVFNQKEWKEVCTALEKNPNDILSDMKTSDTKIEYLKKLTNTTVRLDKNHTKLKNEIFNEIRKELQKLTPEETTKLCEKCNLSKVLQGPENNDLRSEICHRVLEFSSNPDKRTTLTTLTNVYANNHFLFQNSSDTERLTKIILDCTEDQSFNSSLNTLSSFSKLMKTPLKLQDEPLLQNLSDKLKTCAEIDPKPSLLPLLTKFNNAFPGVLTQLDPETQSLIKNQLTEQLTGTPTADDFSSHVTNHLKKSIEDEIKNNKYESVKTNVGNIQQFINIYGTNEEQNQFKEYVKKEVLEKLIRLDVQDTEFQNVRKTISSIQSNVFPAAQYKTSSAVRLTTSPIGIGQRGIATLQQSYVRSSEYRHLNVASGMQQLITDGYKYQIHLAGGALGSSGAENKAWDNPLGIDLTSPPPGVTQVNANDFNVEMPDGTVLKCKKELDGEQHLEHWKLTIVSQKSSLLSKIAKTFTPNRSLDIYWAKGLMERNSGKIEQNHDEIATAAALKALELSTIPSKKPIVNMACMQGVLRTFEVQARTTLIQQVCAEAHEPNSNFQTIFNGFSKEQQASAQMQALISTAQIEGLGKPYNDLLVGLPKESVFGIRPKDAKDALSHPGLSEKYGFYSSMLSELEGKVASGETTFEEMYKAYFGFSQDMYVRARKDVGNEKDQEIVSAATLKAFQLALDLAIKYNKMNTLKQYIEAGDIERIQFPEGKVKNDLKAKLQEAYETALKNMPEELPT